MEKPAVIFGVLARMLVVAIVLVLVGPGGLPVAVGSQGEGHSIRAYRQKRWSFDIQNGVIRFSHGNHLRRDRWFRAYFGTGYNDCTNCHKIEVSQPTDGKRVDFATEIREHENDRFPYGIQEETCLTCHNNVTAPSDCEWCHVPGTKPLEEMEAAELGEFEEEVDKIIPDYKEDFKRGVDTARNYREKRWFFDIQNNNIRFSHGNHKSRDRYFKAYFGTEYEDCGNCHNLGLPQVGEEGLQLQDGEHLNTVEDIRDYEDDIYPFGIMMARCFEACHNGLTAPNDCSNCHLPGARALTEGAAGLSDEMQALVVKSVQTSIIGESGGPGKEIYRQRQCNLCHTRDAAGAPIASDLSDIGNRRDKEWLTQFLRNHQEPQPKVRIPSLKFSDEEALSLAEYLANLKEVR
ncbi:cytochrome c [Acidobacteria bacterium AH-259-D05]|nr:cytochrome c [Acidobacteria bacterium AH-259-D05]